MWLIALLLFLQATDYSAEGLKALDSNKLDEAIELLTKAIGQDPKDYGAHFNLALAYSLQKQDEKGISEYHKVLVLKPGLYQAELNLGIILLRQHRPQDAIAPLESAVAAKPKESRPNLYLADAYLAVSAAEKAEESYRVVLNITPDSAPAELGLARALVLQNRLPEAADHFQKAGPQNRNALLELAQAYEKANQPAEAIAIYQQFPDSPGAQERLGVLLVANKQFSGAIPRLEKAVAAAPTPANRLALANAYGLNNEPQKEIAQLQQAVASTSGDYDLRMRYGRSLRDLRQLAAAAQQFFEAARINPDSVEAWNELASALINNNDYARGLAALDRVKALGKESPGELFLRAITLDKLKQLKPALESYRQFLAADQGAHPDQEFQARQRARIIQLELSKK